MSPLRFITFLAALLLPGLATAQETRPDELVAKITEEVLAAIKSDRELQAADREKALALAQEKILPHIDFKRMAQLAVGRPWRTATPQQQETLTREFRSMIVRTYSNALEAYRGQTMVVEPQDIPPGTTDVRVRNRYISPGKQPVNVDYHMWKTPEGWKVYDIVVGGVSLVATYRPQFEYVVRQSGIEGLIKALADKNQPPPATRRANAPGSA